MENNMGNFAILPESTKQYIINHIDSMNFASAKLMCDVLSTALNSGDIYSNKIVKNIDALDNSLKIVSCDTLDDNSGYCNLDSLWRKGGEFKITTEIGYGKEAFAHEIGHALFDMVDGLQVPSNFDTIITNIKENWEKSPQKLESFLKEAKNYIDSIWNQMITRVNNYMDYNKDTINEHIDMLLNNPELLKKELTYLHCRLTRPTNDIDTFISTKTKEELRSYLFNTYRDEWGVKDFYHTCANDETALIYNKIANIIDSIYNGNNPYYETLYGKGRLSSHSKAYFEKERHQVVNSSFSEQFAEYTSIRLCDMKIANQIAQELFGPEWISIMNHKYQNIANKMEIISNYNSLGNDFEEHAKKAA